MKIQASKVYKSIAANLREFGYPDVTADMIRETDKAIAAGAELPHGIVGMFAQRQLDDLREQGGEWEPQQ